VRLRLNTIGLGDLICGRSIAPEIKECADAVSVSLNTADPEQWAALHVPRPEFRKQGFDAVLGFIASCAKAGIPTTVTAVAQPGVDIGSVRRLARALGARFRSRPWLGARPEAA
jgi:TatD family-associated radical SAM protein